MKTQYTCTLKQYIEDFHHELPTIFDDIPALAGMSFKDMFIDKFCTNEIGFETPDLFARKLNLKATLVCPSYIRKITWYNDNISTLLDQLAGSEESDSGIDTVNVTNDTQNVSRLYGMENPTGSLVTPHNELDIVMTEQEKEQITGHNVEGGKDHTTGENRTTYGKKHTKTELTTQHLDYMLKELPNLYEQLLSEFESLFILLRGNKTWLL